MLKKISLLLFVLWANWGIAQKKFEKTLAPSVTVKDLKETRSAIDSTAPAAYLYRYGNTWYEKDDTGWVMVTEIFTRVKIYTKEGYDYANAELQFYSGKHEAKGKFLDACTYNFENGSIIKTPAKEENTFEKDIDENFSSITLTLPNVKEGSIVEYTTKVTTPYFGNLEDWYFQYDIPAVKVQYDIRIPIYLIYNVYTVGYVDVKRQKDPPLIDNPYTEAKEFWYTYSAENIPPFKDESFVSNRENYIGKLQHELSKMQFPNSVIQNFATDWESMSRKIYSHENFGRELKMDNYFKDDLEALLKGLEGDEAKIKTIFNYVQGRMTWNGRSNFLCKKGVKDAYKEKSGNVAEINLMLTAMLREAGLDANPVILSTRKNGIALFPSVYAYNYVVCAVKQGDKTILLDATSKYTTPGILPNRALNWVGRLIKKNGDNQEIDLMPKTPSKEAIVLMCEVAADGTVTGQARDQYLAQAAYGYREEYAEMSRESYLEEFEKEYEGIQVENYKMTNQNDLEKPLIEEYTFTHNGSAEAIGNKIYINPMIFFTRNETPFKAEKREYAVDFVYPHETRYNINIKIPEGYTVASLPKAINLGMEQNIGSFRYNIAQVGATIQVSAIYTINFASVGQDYYQTLRDFFSKMVEKQNEKIVLVKA